MLDKRIATLTFTTLIVSLVLTLTGCDWFQNKDKEEDKKDTPSQQKPAKKPDEKNEKKSKITLSKPLSFDQLPGWHQDKHAEAWPALKNNCTKMAKREAFWKKVCTLANDLGEVSDAQAKAFFEAHFTPYQIYSGEKGQDDFKPKGLMTGYYEPLLMGSYEKTERFKYPLYQSPTSMITVALDDLFPELKRKRVRGRVVGNKLVPYYTREEIDSPQEPLKGEEIIWIDNLIDVFFLHIQGSGRVQLPDGSVVGAGYANQNGQPYRSIGQVLINQNELDRKNVNLFTLKEWLNKNLESDPEKALAVLNANPSYVFFSLREEVKQGPTGSLNVPLIAERSIAIDPKSVSLGSLMWVDSTYPDGKDTPLQKLVFAQDTGGAIKGELRADMFYGTGKQAEYWAGMMKQYGQYFILLPRQRDEAGEAMTTSPFLLPVE